MSKGKKAKPAKKSSAKSKKPARSKAAKDTEVALAEGESTTDAEATEEAAPEEVAAAEETAAAEADESHAVEAAEQAPEGDAPAEAAASEEAAPAEEPAAIGADEVVVTGGEQPAGEGDDDVPIEPRGPNTAVADLPRPEQKRLVESLVFVSDRAINAQQLGKMLKIKSALAKELADELITEYEGRGIELVELSGGYQFRSAPSSAHVVREHIAQPPVRLTRAQLETLALVAYRQPITRPEIDDVRGVDSGSALRVLLERGLLKMLGRKDEPGRPLLYGTTPFFLDFFGMRTLKDLPTLREFTELSEENRALFKKKTGETIEEAEAALLAAEEAAQRDSLAAPSNEGEAEPPPTDDAPAAAEDASEGEAGAQAEGAGEAEPTDRDLEVEAETFAAGSLQTSPDSTSNGHEREDEGELDESELPQAPEA